MIRHRIVAAMAISLLWPGLVSATASPERQEGTAEKSRLEGVAERGAEVMGFDLNSTQHVFTKTIEGGFQEVRAKGGQGSNQVPRIRHHLAGVAQAFQKGDFSAPAAIHGPNMPGLGELRRAGSRLKVVYAELPDGGRITYRSVDAGIIEAIHRWFDAQLTDHGSHASKGSHHSHVDDQ